MSRDVVDTARNRRDRRYEPLPGSAFIEFDNPDEAGSRLSSVVTRISVAGLAFEWEENVQSFVNDRLQDVTLRVDNCELRGDLVVRNRHPKSGSCIEIGCMFYPATELDTMRLMAVIAGMGAVTPA